MKQFIRVRNWDRFQHYKDRSPPWIKLHRELLTSETWVSVDDASRVLAIAIMLLAAATDNKIPANKAYLRRAAYLNADPDWSALVDAQFIEIVDDDGNPLADASKALAKRTECSSEERRDRGERETEHATRGVGKASKKAPKEFAPDLTFASQTIPDVDAATEAARFKDYEFKTPRSDWDGTWRNWIRKCKDTGQYARKEQTKWM